MDNYFDKNYGHPRLYYDNYHERQYNYDDYDNYVVKK